MKDFLDKVDNDAEWFPGKQYGEKRGRKRVLTGPKAVAIERCAKAHKGKRVASNSRTDVQKGAWTERTWEEGREGGRDKERVTGSGLCKILEGQRTA